MSYTTFKYDDVSVKTTSTTVTTTLKITNTGPVDGAEIVQLYMSMPASAKAPVKQLKGFTKVSLPTGATRSVVLSVPISELSVWQDGWVVKPGQYTAHVGASATDIKLSSLFEIDSVVH